MSLAQNLVLYAVPFFVLAIAGELWISRRIGLNSYEWRDTGLSIIFTLTFFGSLAWYDPVQALIASASANYALFDIPMTWWTLLLCVVLDDFAYYVDHVILHKTRWGWAVHVVHHSGSRLNLLTASRLSPLHVLLPTIIVRIPLLVIGFAPEAIFFCMSFSLIYQFFLHTELRVRLPDWVEYVFNTPRHHQVHHASNPACIDRNFGAILIVWDRMFGTIQENEFFQGELQFGATGVEPTDGVARILFGGFGSFLKSDRDPQR